MNGHQFDGQCRTCGGQLDINEADDATMTITSLEPGCGDSYLIELDALNDGCMKSYVSFMAERLEEHSDDE